MEGVAFERYQARFFDYRQGGNNLQWVNRNALWRPSGWICNLDKRNTKSAMEHKNHGATDGKKEVHWEFGPENLSSIPLLRNSSFYVFSSGIPVPQPTCRDQMTTLQDLAVVHCGPKWEVQIKNSNPCFRWRRTDHGVSPVISLQGEGGPETRIVFEMFVVY